LVRLLAQALGALDRIGHIVDRPSAPPAQLVAEESEATSPPGSYRALANDAALGSVVIGDGRHLDHEAPIRHAYDQRRMVEVAGFAALQPCRQGLEDAAVPPYGMMPSPQREPEEIDGR
jgi:hypothetical protein